MTFYTKFQIRTDLQLFFIDNWHEFKQKFEK
jgi:hypothetical protein